MGSSLSLITVVVVVGLTEVKSVRNGKGFKMEPVIAGFILGVLLFSLDMVNARLSRTLCGLIIVATLIYNGSSLSAILSQTSGKKATKQKSPRSPRLGGPNAIQ